MQTSPFDVRIARRRERAARLAEARQYDGCRYAHYAKSTGTLVTVVSAEAQGLDPGEHGETKWYTTCEDHNRLIGHATLALAKHHAPCPEGWCEVCQGTDTPDEEDA